MERAIVVNFETRRDAESAVEHLVQEHSINRSDIFIRAAGEPNTVGVRPAGADVESGPSWRRKTRGSEVGRTN